MVSSSTKGSCNIFPKLPLSWDFPAAQQPKIRRRRVVATRAAASNKYLARLGVRPLTWQRQHNKRTNTAAMPGMMMIISQGAGFPTESRVGDEPQITAGPESDCWRPTMGPKAFKMKDGRLGIWPTGQQGWLELGLVRVESRQPSPSHRGRSSHVMPQGGREISNFGTLAWIDSTGHPSTRMPVCCAKGAHNLEFVQRKNVRKPSKIWICVWWSDGWFPQKLERNLVILRMIDAWHRKFLAL